MAVIHVLFLAAEFFMSSMMFMFSVFFFFFIRVYNFSKCFFWPNLVLFFDYFFSSFFIRRLRFFNGEKTFSVLTISSGNLYLFFLAVASLIFLYFSLIFLAASCTFLPGSKVAISSKTFNISVVSVSFGVSLVSFLMHGFLVVFFFTFVVKFSFLKSVESISVLIK